MKIYKVEGQSGTIQVDTYNNGLSVGGNVNSDSVKFIVKRYIDNVDLSIYNCFIKTKNSKQQTDIVTPVVEIFEQELEVTWTISANTTQESGVILVQLEFRNAVISDEPFIWQSGTAKFMVESSIDPDGIFEQNVSLFEEWDKKINDIYVDISGKYSTIDEKIELVNEALPKMDSAIELINDFTENILPTLSSDAKTLMGKTVDDSKNDTTALWTAEKTNEVVDAAVQQIDAQITAINQGTDFLTAQIDSLNTTISESAADIVTMQESIAEMSEKVSALPFQYSFLATAEYSNGIYKLGIPNFSGTLPKISTITFEAPSDVKSGDKIKVVGIAAVVNCYGKGIGSNVTPGSGDNAIYIGNGYVKLATTATDKYVALFSDLSAKNYLKTDTLYTAILDIKSLSNPNGQVYVSISNKTFDPFTEIKNTNKLGESRILLRTQPEFTSQNLFNVQYNGAVNGAVETAIFRCMLLEGDWTTAVLPADYWEGTYGEYEIKGYGNPETVIVDGQFATGQVVTLNVNQNGAFFSA